MPITRKCERCGQFHPGDYFTVKNGYSNSCIHCRIIRYKLLIDVMDHGHILQRTGKTFQMTIPMFLKT
jgi:hypothetical protein